MNNMYDILAKFNSAAGPAKTTLTEGARPDFLDIDKDGNKKEPMKQAAKQAKDKKVEEGQIEEKISPPIKTDPNERGKYKGKDIADLKAMKAANLKKTAGYKERGEAVPDELKGKTAELNFAIRAKQAHGGKWGKIKEGDMEEGNEFTDARLAAIKAGKPMFKVGGKSYKVTGDTSDERKQVDELDISLIKAAQKHAKEHPTKKDPESERNIHKKYGYRTDRDDTGDDDDYDEWGNEKKSAKKAQSKAEGPKKKGRPKGTGRSIGAKGPTGKSKLLKKGAIKEEGAESSEIEEAIAMLKDCGYTVTKAVEEVAPPGAKAERMVKHIKKAYAKDGKLTPKEKSIAYATAWKAHKAGKVEEESTETRDERAEKAGRKVAKDIEYDEKVKDKIHGKKRGSEDDKAERAGRKVTKDIEYDEKVDETTVAGAVATAPAAEAPKAKGKKGSIQFGKGVYESKLEESYKSRLERMLTEGISINASQGEDGNKSLTVNATDEDAVKLAQLLQLAGMPQGHDYHDVCPGCGKSPCGCEEVEESLANSPDEVYANTELINTQGEDLHKPKSTGQTTVPILNKDAARQGVSHEMAKIREEAESRLWKLYQKYEG